MKFSLPRPHHCGSFLAVVVLLAPTSSFALVVPKTTTFSIRTPRPSPPLGAAAAASDDNNEYTPRSGEVKINLKHDLDSPKVVTMEQVARGGKNKKVYCRCWLSDTFPLCDGRHMKHNAATGDNVGPLIVSSPSSVPKEQPDDDSKSKKVKGRKQRVQIGLTATAVTYLVCAAQAVLVQMGGSISKPLSIYYASGPALAAGISYILVSAAKHDRLQSDTYKRLNLALGAFGLVGLAMVALAPDIRQNPPLLLVASALATINAAKGYAYGVLGWDKKNTETSLVEDLVKGTKSTVKGFLSVPQNMQSAVYQTAMVMVEIMKLAKLAEICKSLLNKNEATTGLVLASRLSRFGRLALLNMVLYTLKDAADRDRLQGTTFIQLNFLASVSLAAMSFYLGGAVATRRLGCAAAVFSVFTAANGVASVVKKKKKA